MRITKSRNLYPIAMTGSPCTKHSAFSCRRNAFTLAELAVLLAVGAVASIFLLVSCSESSPVETEETEETPLATSSTADTANQHAGGRTDRRMLCASQLKLIQTSFILVSVQEGTYPIPTDISRDTAAASVAPGDSTANLHALMINAGAYKPDQVVCPNEKNPNVEIKSDYERTQMGAPDIAFWDTTFDCDVTGSNGRVSNVSYANLAPTGQRFVNEWSDTLNDEFIVFADRGPANGVHDTTSKTYASHDPANEWAGNIVYNDSSVVFFKNRGNSTSTSFIPNRVKWTDSKGRQRGDNIFANDDTDTGSDIWLGIFVKDTSAGASSNRIKSLSD